MMRAGIIAAVALVLTACSSPGQWVGQDASVMLAARGAPDRETRTPDGLRYLSYVEYPYGNVMCRRNYTIAPTGKVLSYTTNCIFS